MEYYSQISLFDGKNKFVLDKEVRLIEFFGGYGSQALGLKYANIPFKHHKLSEWAVKSIQAYKDLHFTEDNTDYSKGLTDLEIIDFLDGKISANYDTPMTREQIIKHSGKEQWRRQVYNNMKATNNLGSIINVRGSDLDITETDKYIYMLTYSFPCQDLSTAGQRKGFEKDSGTRSGLLWEVGRILKECEVKPQVLIMENVPDITNSKNIKLFTEWQNQLVDMGYKNKWEIINAKNQEIPQNRERCFMVSVLGDYYYDFPCPKPLKTTLNDYLEEEVDEKYYLSDKQLVYVLDCNRVCDNTKRGDCLGIVVRSKNQHLRKLIGEIESCETQALDTYNQTTHNGFVQTIRANIDKRNEDFLFKDLRIRKFTPRECFRLMGVKDEDFDKIAKNQSNASLYHLAGDSIVVNVLMAIYRSML